MAKAGRGSDQFPLRLPDGLRDRIKAKAEANGRSMNAEIIARLEESFEVEDVTNNPEAAFNLLQPVLGSVRDEMELRLERIESAVSSFADILQNKDFTSEELKSFGSAIANSMNKHKSEKKQKTSDKGC